MDQEHSILLGGVEYLCPPPSPSSTDLATQLLQEDPELSIETLSCILEFATRRGYNEALLSVERFLVERL